ncbi:hypothetical protein ACWEPM_34005 [Streptomyces sp. NPDC004244]
MLITQAIDKHRNTRGVVMNEQSVPAAPNRAETAASCCGPAPAPPAAETIADTVPTQSSPCCGTSKDAEEVGACCAPEAKREAVATGAGCC